MLFRSPQKLAGQCGKLKCCLNFELDTYLDALKDFPKGNVSIKTKSGSARLQKTDIFKRIMWFTTAEDPGNFIPLSVDKVKQIIEQNKKGVFPQDLKNYINEVPVVEQPDFENVVGQDSVNRFDQKSKSKGKHHKRKPRPNQKNRNKKKD